MGSLDHFLQRFLLKTEHELKAIVNSALHVDEAKQAAKRILEERGIKVDFIEQKPKPIQRGKFKVFKFLDGIRIRKHNPIALVICGLMIILSAILINFQHLTTSEKQLVKLQGSIKSAKVIIDKVSVRGKFGKVHTSRKASLYFSLFEHQKLFMLSENIGDDFEHKEYESLSNSLTRADLVTISINQSEVNQFSPKVFQIEVDNRIVLDFKSINRENEGLFLLMLLFGIILIALGLRLKALK